MSDQLLPDFDGPRDDPAPAGPKKPKPRPQRKRAAKKVAKRTKRELAMVVVAKRVPKKRRVRKVVARPVLTAAEKELTPLSSGACTAIRLLMEMQASERKLVIVIAQTLGK